MKSAIAIAVGAFLVASTARAQAPASTASADDQTGYVQGVVQSAFGNVTSQSFGVEGGLVVGRRLLAFAELGLVRDTAPSGLGTAAQVIAGYLTQVQTSAVSYSVRQPARFLSAGLKYMIPYRARIEPYVLGGLGLAGVERDVRFSVGGSDVTDAIANYGVVLGRDLAGTETKPMLTVGAGAVWTARSSLFVDAHYRHSRIFTDSQGTPVNRVGLGIGVRF